ncbi:hypothetical protein A2Z00_03510 [Candidatus Gottesmanbacteria bacterium RBG_13_45_10]|uniref:Type IV pilus modification protein PilV n=1 Tax=Candidatus Gottesmanbacteria bacterium RBG_13_45_10 TaxID=1798370 RepID=A0A1F5ZH96_9BACT|nr:MAG: hypothetical protein A2Z00_03510 [Candidatus Gottesmanbacteria bacterium RBG_13_45_10]
MRTFYRQGQTIVEAIVVIAVVVILTTGVIAGTTASLRSAQDGRVRTQAIRFAQEGVEILRTLRDENWTTFYQHTNQTWCLGSDGILTAASGGACSPNITTSEGTNLTRKVTLTWNDPTIIAGVNVSYPITDTVARSVLVTTYLTQWK